MRISNIAEAVVVGALKEFEERTGQPVTWDLALQLVPTEDESGMVPAIGCYFYIPGPTSETVVGTTFYYMPYLIDADELRTTVTQALDNLLAKKQDEISKIEKVAVP